MSFVFIFSTLFHHGFYVLGKCDGPLFIIQEWKGQIFGRAAIETSLPRSHKHEFNINIFPWLSLSICSLGLPLIGYLYLMLSIKLNTSYDETTWMRKISNVENTILARMLVPCICCMLLLCASLAWLWMNAQGRCVWSTRNGDSDYIDSTLVGTQSNFLKA